MIELAHIIPIIQQFLPEIEESTAGFIAEKVKVLEVKKNEVLLKKGKVCDRVYLVLQGGFVCRYINEAHDIQKTINFYLEDLHPFMACVDSFFSQQPGNCELRAISNATVLELHKKDLDKLLEMDLRIREFYNTVVIQALVEENELKLNIIALSAEQLYDYIMKHFPMVIKKVPSKYIAELMGISAEWLSKLKKSPKK
jgi:CRP-like cAMP-binding protein